MADQTETEELITEGQEAAEPAEEAPPTPEEQLNEAQALAAEYLDGWQRARAELANFKRRTEAQRAEMVVNASQNLLQQLLPALDDLQLALEKAPTGEANCSEWGEWRDGVALVAHKFAAVLDRVGVVPIEVDGQEFDPTVHEAISYEEHPDLESGQIIAQVRQGYMLGERVLRAAMVRVAK